MDPVRLKTHELIEAQAFAAVLAYLERVGASETLDELRKATGLESDDWPLECDKVPNDGNGLDSMVRGVRPRIPDASKVRPIVYRPDRSNKATPDAPITEPWSKLERAALLTALSKHPAEKYTSTKVRWTKISNEPGLERRGRLACMDFCEKEGLEAEEDYEEDFEVVEHGKEDFEEVEQGKEYFEVEESKPEKEGFEVEESKPEKEYFEVVESKPEKIEAVEEVEDFEVEELKSQSTQSAPHPQNKQPPQSAPHPQSTQPPQSAPHPQSTQPPQSAPHPQNKQPPQSAPHPQNKQPPQSALDVGTFSSFPPVSGSAFGGGFGSDWAKEVERRKEEEEARRRREEEAGVEEARASLWGGGKAVDVSEASVFSGPLSNASSSMMFGAGGTSSQWEEVGVKSGGMVIEEVGEEVVEDVEFVEEKETSKKYLEGGEEEEEKETSKKYLEGGEEEMEGDFRGNVDEVGENVAMEEAEEVQDVLLGKAGEERSYAGRTRRLNAAWAEQGLCFCSRTGLRYGLLQHRGGPCGALAAVQAAMLRRLIFGRREGSGEGGRRWDGVGEIGEVGDAERNEALIDGIADIVWRVAECTEGVARLAIPCSSGRPVAGIALKTLTLDSWQSLRDSVAQHIRRFMAPEGSGVACVLLSCILTRSPRRMREDWGGSGGVGAEGCCIGRHDYATHEGVALMLLGRARAHPHDGEKDLGGGMVLHGTDTRTEEGFLTLFEHYGYTQVGLRLKQPIYPVWVICSESHYTVTFSLDPLTATQTSLPVDLYYWDGLAGQDEEIRWTLEPPASSSPSLSDSSPSATIFTSTIGSMFDGPKKSTSSAIDSFDASVLDTAANRGRRGAGGLGDADDKDNDAPPLELVLRTRWPKAHVNWNGVEPWL